MFKVTCRKCNGTGNIPMFNFQDGGVCYDCMGKGYEMRKTKPVELFSYYVTAIIKEGWKNCGNRGGVVVNAKNEKDALKKAKLHPDCYDLETIQANIEK